MTHDQKPNRRRLQFSLRTMLLVMTLVCVGFGYWVHWSKEWIRQREEWRGEHPLPLIHKPKLITAPSGLWLFGEEGEERFGSEPEYIDQARQLFPEAKVYPVHPVFDFTIPREH